MNLFLIFVAQQFFFFNFPPFFVFVLGKYGNYQVKNALSILYSHENRGTQEIRAADQWLRSFQDTVQIFLSSLFTFRYFSSNLVLTHSLSCQLPLNLICGNRLHNFLFFFLISINESRFMLGKQQIRSSVIHKTAKISHFLTLLLEHWKKKLLWTLMNCPLTLMRLSKKVSFLMC